MKWIGLAEKNPNRAGEVAPKIGADFVTQSHVELLKRPEVTCAIIATDEHLHVDPIMAAVERGIPLLIEKPLATDLAQSAKVLKAIKDAKIDAVVGYTQRFRSKWLAGKEKVRTGALGDVTLVTSRAFMNRLVAIDNYKRTDDPDDHLADGDLRHARARHVHVVPGKENAGRMLCALDRQGAGPALPGHRRHRRHDHDVGRQHLSSQHLLGAAGDVAGRGLFARGRHHRHRRRAHHRRHPPRHGAGGSKPQGEGYAPDQSRLVDFLGSYPPGDMALGELRGPMADETDVLAQPRRARPADAGRDREEAHNNLMLTKALDLSAKRKQPVRLPLDPDEEKRAA